MCLSLYEKRQGKSTQVRKAVRGKMKVKKGLVALLSFPFHQLI